MFLYAIQQAMTSIFISHSSKDNEAANSCKKKLLEAGHRGIFLDFDPADGIPAGRKWEQELYAQLRGCRAIVVLCSPHSMKSPWCFAEITHAKALGKEVFPIKIADCEIVGLLKERQVIDCTHFGEKKTYDQLREGLVSAGIDPKNAFDWDNSRSPYPGLLAFEAEDAAIYFGRDDDIRKGRELLNRLRDFQGARLALVLGMSGCGKSSLVKAGILPRLKNTQNWLVLAPFRPQQDPFAELAKVIQKKFESYGTVKTDNTKWLEKTESPEERVKNLLAKLSELKTVSNQEEATVLIPIDQFEELLGDSASKHSNKFLIFLYSLLEHAGASVMVLGTLRSDFLGSFQAHPNLKDLNFETLLVNPPGHDAIAQIVQCPADVAGLELEPGLVPLLVHDTKDGNALPLLAFTLRELFEGYGDDNKLEIREYEKLGGLKKSVARAAQTILDGYCPPRKSERAEVEESLRHALLKLVRIDEEGKAVRAIARWEDLPVAAHPLLERFVQGRLLVSRGDEQNRVLEISHEALFSAWPLLQEWISESKVQLRKKQKIEADAKEWEADNESEYLLLSGKRLREVERFDAQYGEVLPLNNLGRAFLQASLNKRKEHNYRWLRRGGYVVGIGLIAMGAWGVIKFTPGGQLWQVRRGLAYWSRRINDDELQSMAAIAFAKDGKVEQASQLLELIEYSSVKAEAITGIAEAISQLEVSEQAANLLQTALNSTDQIEHPSSKASAITGIAEASSQLKNPEQAATILQAALASTDQIEDSYGKAWTLTAIAKASSQLENSEQAATILQAALASADQMEDSYDKALALLAIAKTSSQLENPEQAANLLQTALASTDQIEDSYDKAWPLLAIAEASSQLENSEQAANLIQTALASTDQIEDSDDKARTLTAIAEANSQLEDPEQAATILKAVLTSTDQIEDSTYKAKALSAIAKTSSQLENPEQVVTILQNALASADQIKDSYGKVRTLRTIAEASSQLEDPKQATTILQAVLASADQIKDSLSKAEALIGISDAYRQLEDPEQATTILEQAAIILQAVLANVDQMEDPIDKVIELAAIADAYRQLEDPEQATIILQDALANFDKIVDLFDRDTAMKAIAEASSQLEDSDRATALLQAALASVDKTGDSLRRGETLVIIARASSQLEDPEQAIIILQAAFARVDQMEDPSNEPQNITIYYNKPKALAAIAELFAYRERWRTTLKAANLCPNRNCRVELLSQVLTVHAEEKNSKLKKEE